MIKLMLSHLIKNFTLIFCLLLSPKLHAACKTVTSIKWPDELIFFYFNKPGPKIIVLPYDFCKPTGALQMLNSDNQPAGIFTVSASAYSWYNNLVVKSPKTAAITKKYHKNVGQMVNPLNMTDLMLKQFNTNLAEHSDKNLLFVEGRFQANSSSLKWNPYQSSNTHWFAKNIDYKMLISLYTNPKIRFIGFAQDEIYRFPKVIFSNSSLPRIYRYDIKNLVENNNNHVFSSDEQVVVLSSDQTAFEAYNYISELSLTHKKQVYWFNDANLKWIQLAKKIKPMKFDGLVLSNINDFFKNILSNPNHNIVDIRDLEKFQEFRFQKSTHLSVKFMSADELRDLYVKSGRLQTFNTLPEQKKKIGDYVLSNLSQIPKTSKIYLLTDHLNEPLKAKTTYKQLQRQGYKNIELLKESIAELLIYSEQKKLDRSKIFVEPTPSFNSLPAFL